MNHRTTALIFLIGVTVLGNPVEIRNFATAIRGVESGGQIKVARVR